MPEKTGAEAVAQNIAEAKEKATQAVEEVKSLNEGVKELAKGLVKSLTDGFASIKEKEATEEMKSLNAKLEEKSAEANNLKEKFKLFDAGQGIFGQKENTEEAKSFLKAFAKAMHSSSTVNVEEFKTIRITDPTSVGGFIPTSVNRGIVDVNAQPIITLIDDVDVLPSVNTLKEESFFLGYDSSVLDLDEAVEMDAATVKRTIEHSAIKIISRKEQASIAVSSDVMLSAMNGDSTALNVIDRNLQELNTKFLRKCVKKGFQDIIANANSSDTNKISKVVTTLDTVDEASMRKDLRNLPTNLKKQYIDSSILYISRSFLNALFAKEASDGHLPLEQFVYQNQLTYFLTPEKSYLVKTFEHNQVGDYFSLKDGTTAITTDYDPSASAGGNAGKLLAIVGDFKKGYKFQGSTVSRIGSDNSIRELLTGVVAAGLISYVAQGLGVKESLKVLYSK